MINESGNNKRFLLDMAWYLAGTLVPMGIGFIKTPIFTRYFTPEEYGYLGIISITFSYLSVFVYSWLASCLWRYYNAYKNKGDLKNLFSNIFGIYLAATIGMFLISATWYVLATNPLVKQLILLSFILVLIKELLSLMLIVVRLEGKAVKYNTIHSLRAILSFIVLYGMTFGFGWRITSVLISAIAIDSLALLAMVLFSRQGISVSSNYFSRETLKLLFRFGSVGLISNFFFLLITSSDRYIIALFEDMSTVGIYNQVYTICQLSVVALVTVYFNTINPKLNKELEVNYSESDQLIRDYLFAFLLIGMPLVTYLSLFPRQIALVLLGPEFRSGYVIMPYIFISSFLYGLFLFIELKFKFAEKLKNIVIGVGLASIMNIAINFIMIPQYGYLWAAVSTLMAYLFLIFYFYLQDDFGFFSHRQFQRKLLIAGIVLTIQVVFDYWIRSQYTIDLWGTILEVLLFSLSYLALNLKSIKKLKLQI